MKTLLFLGLLFLSIPVSAQQNEPVIMGQPDSVYSTILKESRKIWVHVPGNYSPDGFFAQEHYPVIYLLDGWEQNFAVITAIEELLSGGGGNLSFPKMIVVGIPNTERTRDLTPTHSMLAPGMDAMEASTSGGGEKFISFIQKELIPHIDSLYPTTPFRILAGHSLGGLMALYTLVNHTALFNAYVAIDPSTFWDHQLVLHQMKLALQENRFTGRSLFLATANTMNSGFDTGIIGPIMRCNFQLRDDLKMYRQSKLVWRYKYYPDYDHNSVPVPAAYDALRFTFNFYNLNFPFTDFFKPTFKADTLLAAHYQMISRRMGYRVSPPEQFVNVIGYQLMGMKQFDRAYYFFKMNADNYPQSFHAYDSMGDLFAARGDRKKAIEYYGKSLDLHDSPDTHNKLEKLLGK